MTDPSPGQATQLLIDLSSGDTAALEKLTPLIYDELHRLAHRFLRRERGGHTLQTTALVNEAYLRLVDQRNLRWQNRAHFFGIAAQAMRRILVDHARAHAAAKRGSGERAVPLEEALVAVPGLDVDLLALDEALNRLTAIDAVQGRVIELKFFGGLTIEEIAAVLHVSPATVGREWTLAKAWLYAELGCPGL